MDIAIIFDEARTSLRAFLKGYVWFQVAITTGDEWVEVDSTMSTIGYDTRNVYRFATYSAANRKLNALLAAGEYATVSMLGFNWWAKLAGSQYGAWHSFYLASRKPVAAFPVPYVASARLM